MPDPIQDNDKVKALYDGVSKDYNLGTYPEFKAKLQDPIKRKAFYEGVGKEYQLGTYDEFEAKVGASKKKVVTQPSTQPVQTSTSGAATQVPTSTPLPLEEKKQPKVENPKSSDLLDASIDMIDVDLIKKSQSDDYVDLVSSINLPADTKDLVTPNRKGGINILSGTTGEKTELNPTAQQQKDIQEQVKQEAEKLKTAKTWSEQYGKEVANGTILKVDDNFKTGESRFWYNRLKSDNPNWDGEYLEMRSNGVDKIIPLPYERQEKLQELPFANVGDLGEAAVSASKTKDADVNDWYNTQLGNQAINLDTRANTPERLALENNENFKKFNTYDRLRFAMKEMPQAMTEIGKRFKKDEVLWNNFKTEIDNLDEKDVASEFGINEAFKKAVIKSYSLDKQFSPETYAADQAASKLKSLQVAYNNKQDGLTAKIKLAGEGFLEKSGYADELLEMKEFEKMLLTNPQAITNEQKAEYELNKQQIGEAIAKSGIDELKGTWEEYVTNKNIFTAALASAKDFLNAYKGSDKSIELQELQRQKEGSRLLNQSDGFFPSVRETVNKQEELAKKGGDPLYKSIPKSFYGAFLQGVDDAAMFFMPEGKSKAKFASMFTNSGKPSMMADLQVAQTDNPFYNMLNSVSGTLGGVAPSMMLGRFGMAAELMPFFAGAAENAKTQAKKEGIKGVDAELYGAIMGTIAAGTMAIKLPSSYLGSRIAKDDFYAIINAAANGDKKTVTGYILKQLTPTAAGAKHIGQAELQVLATEIGNNITNTIYNRQYGTDLHTGINAEQFVNMAAFSWLMGRVGKSADIAGKGMKEMILQRYEESPKDVIQALDVAGVSREQSQKIKDLLANYDKLKADLPKDVTYKQKIAASTILTDIQGLQEKSANTQNAEIKQAIDKNISQKQGELAKILADDAVAEKYIEDATKPIVDEMQQDLDQQKEEVKKIIAIETPKQVEQQQKGEIITTKEPEYTPETKKSGVSIILPKEQTGEIITTKPIEKTTTESIEQKSTETETGTIGEPIKVSETAKEEVVPTKESNVDLIDIENYTAEDKAKRDKNVDSNGYHYVNIFEGQILPLNIGLSGYGDKSGSVNKKLDYYNPTAKENETAFDVGDKVSFSAFVRDSIDSVGKYKVRNETTGKEYALQWFTKSNDPRIALKEVESKLGLSKKQPKSETPIVEQTKEAQPIESREQLIEKAKSLSDNVQGLYKDVFKKNTQETLFEAAMQANSSEGEKKGAVATFGKEIVDIAQELYPNAKVGDKFEQAKETTKAESRTSEKISSNESSQEADQPTKKVTVIEPETAAKNAEVNRIRNEFGFEDLPEVERLSNAEAQKTAQNLIDEWKGEGDYKEEIEKIKKDFSKGVISLTGENVLTQHLADLRVTAKKIDRYSKEYDKLIQEIKETTDALQQVGTTAARIMEARKGFIRGKEIESVFDVEMDMLKNKQVFKLTEQEKKEAEERFTMLEQANVEAQKALEVLEIKNAELLEQLAIERAKNENTKNTPAKRAKKKEDYVKERLAIKQSIKDKWKNTGKDMLSMDIPYRKQLAAIAPDVARLIGSYLEEGAATTLEAVRKLLKKDLEEIGIETTDRDISSLIAGEFNEKKQTRSEIANQVYLIRREQKILLEMDRILSGEEPKTETKKRERNKKIADLEKQLKELKKDYKVGQYSDEAKFLTVLKQQISKNENDTIKLEKRIQNKDFAPEVKEKSVIENEELHEKYPAEWQAYKYSLVKKAKAAEKYEELQLHDVLENRSKLRKTLDKLGYIPQTYVGIKAMFDASFVLVQNAIPTLARIPSAAKAIKQMFQTNARKFDEQMALMHNNKAVWDLIEFTGTRMYEPTSSNFELRMETMGGSKNLLNKDFTIAGKKFSIGKFFERQNALYTNSFRLQLLMEQVEKLVNDKKTPENAPEEYKAAGEVANVLTAYGTVPKALQGENISAIMNAVIWSTRMLSSTFQIIGASDAAAALNKAITKKDVKGFYGRLTPDARKFVAKEIGMATLSAVSIMYGIKLMTSLFQEDEDVEVNLNPTDKNFFSLRYGNDVYEPLGRFSSTVSVLGAAVLQTARTMGIDTKLGVRGKDEESGTMLTRKFIRGKMRPDVGLAYDYFFNKGKNSYTGKPLSGKDLLPLPMSVDSFMKDLEKDEGFKLAVATIFKYLGLQSRLNEYPKEKKKTGKKGFKKSNQKKKVTKSKSN